MEYFRKGEVTFRSENVTTISIVKEFITKEATKRRSKLEIQLSKLLEIRVILNSLHTNCLNVTDVNNASVSYMIDMISPLLRKYGTINDEYQMINNLIDLDIQDASELRSLGTEYVSIFERKTKIIEEYEETAHMLERIVAVINGIYVDFNRLKGNDVRSNTAQLREYIGKYDNKLMTNFILGTLDEEPNWSTEQQHNRFPAWLELWGFFFDGFLDM